jgi:cysteine sulfinate desulfinase/cysteine desulfurase-like protein
VVVKAISGDPTRAQSTLRISLSRETTLQNLKDLTKVLKSHIEKMSQY